MRSSTRSGRHNHDHYSSRNAAAEPRAAAASDAICA
jgi:hypothetical protein